MKRALLMLISIAMLLSMMASCSSGQNPQNDEKNDSYEAGAESGDAGSDVDYEEESEKEAEEKGQEESDKKCKHEDAKVVGAKEPTCKEEGYSGDRVCSDCSFVLGKGKAIPKKMEHESTYISGAVKATKDAPGYTGDSICEVCGLVLVEGEVIPKIVEQVRFSDHYGNSITLPKDTDVFKHTLDAAVVPNVEHPTMTCIDPNSAEVHHLNSHELETAVFDTVNAERKKNGIAPLEWCEEAYYFSYTRVRELDDKFSGERPNGEKFAQIFAEYKVIPGDCSENVYSTSVVPDETMARTCVDFRMNKPDQREDILNPKYKRTAIAVYWSTETNQFYVEQLFFG